MKNILFLFSGILLFGCKKDKGSGNDDTEKPVVTITSPTNNQQFNFGQVVSLKAQVSDNRMLREIHLEILNTTSNTLYTHEHYTPGSDKYSFDQTLSLPSSGTYQIKIEAEDDSGNEAETAVTVKLN